MWSVTDTVNNLSQMYGMPVGIIMDMSERIWTVNIDITTINSGLFSLNLTPASEELDSWINFHVLFLRSEYFCCDNLSAQSSSVIHPGIGRINMHIFESMSKGGHWSNETGSMTYYDNPSFAFIDFTKWQPGMKSTGQQSSCHRLLPQKISPAVSFSRK